GHHTLVGVANLAVAARVSECRGWIPGIRNPHAVKRDVECRFARGCRRHALADGAHVAVDAFDALIRVLAARQARASGVHLPVRLLGRSAQAVARFAKLLRRLPQFRLLHSTAATSSRRVLPRGGRCRFNFWLSWKRSCCNLSHQSWTRNQQCCTDCGRLPRAHRWLDKLGRPIRGLWRMAGLSSCRSDRWAAYHRGNFWNCYSRRKVDLYTHP